MSLRAAARPLVAVLGLGEMGTIHARALARARGVRLGLASGRSGPLADAAAMLHADRTWPGYAEALADPDVSAVVIATPPPSHAGLIVDAVQAGKEAIFSEKPLGYSVREIRGAVGAVVDGGVARFMCGFQRRWDAGYRRGRDVVDRGECGKPIGIKCTSGDASYPEKYLRPGAGAEHSMLKDLAVHDVDLARWLLKSEVKRVYVSAVAMSYPQLAEFGDADMVMAVLEMESGARSALHLSRALAYGYNVTTELVCDGGTVQMGDLKATAAVVLKDGTAATDIAPAFPDRFVQAFESQMDAFVRLVLAESDEEARKIFAGNPSYAGAVDGLRVTEVAEALVKSVETNSVVDVVRESV
jgi:predicted dehydrogenase